MDFMTFSIFLFAAILSIVHFFSDKFASPVEKFHSKIISFSAGIFITYIFLSLMPEFLNGTEFIGTTSFGLLLAGFVAFHVLEKYLYQHITNKDVLMKDLAEIHTIGFFFDQFVIGMLLFFAFNVDDIFVGGIVFLPLLLHTISSSLSLQHIHEYFNKNLILNITLSTAPFLGVLFVFLLNPPVEIYYSIFSFVIGALLYVVIRDTLPKGKAGSTEFFLIGVIVSAALIFFAKQIETTGIILIGL